jgi:hypothetical protein
MNRDRDRDSDRSYSLACRAVDDGSRLVRGIAKILAEQVEAGEVSTIAVVAETGAEIREACRPPSTGQSTGR